MHNIICKNCGNLYHGHYCNNCGQKNIHERLTTHEVWHDIVHVFTHADKSIFGFAKLALLQPGIVAKEYLAGKRKRYFNPIQFFILLTTVTVFVLTITHLDDKIFAIASYAPANANPKAAEINGKFMGYMKLLTVKYQAIFNLLTLPLYTMAMGWLLKRYQLNFAERYLIGMMAYNQYYILLTFIVYPLMFFIPNEWLGVYSLLTIVVQCCCFGITFKQYNNIPMLEGLALGIANCILGLLLAITTMLIIIIIGFIVLLVSIKMGWLDNPFV